MNQSPEPQPKSYETSSNHVGERIAFIQSCWHRDIVDQCRIAFVAELCQLGTPETRLDIFEVPGAFEIPLQAKLLARTRRYAAIVAAGFVVDGGIYRHEFVGDAVIAGLMQIQLETDVPIISAVLTPQQFHEHEDHKRFFREHLAVKGIEAARACTQTIVNINKFASPYARELSMEPGR
jgi:6,7-dimethyl-8-ribityllumazine synthase